ncbi:MAG: hypothetical protein JM58_14420 [Peptococcaceae bacterium BICA1-8]|nr:MAG: hypothetical protein JM58_14420 [Peptococcaceae bacterium BICA1-8]
MKTLVLGAGRMGSSVIKYLASKGELLVYDRNEDKIEVLKNEFNLSIRLASFDDLFDTDYLFMVISADGVRGFLEEHIKELKPGATVVNMATALPNEGFFTFKRYNKRVNLVQAKIVGHYKELELEPLVLFLEGENKEQVADILRDWGKLYFMDTDIVHHINGEAVKQAISAVEHMKGHIVHFRLPKEVETALLRNVLAGTLKAYAEDDIGPYFNNV